MYYWEKVSCYRVSHTLVFISCFRIEWIQKPGLERGRERGGRGYELTKFNFIEGDEIQFQVDSVNIDPRFLPLCGL